MSPRNHLTHSIISAIAIPNANAERGLLSSSELLGSSTTSYSVSTTLLFLIFLLMGVL